MPWKGEKDPYKIWLSEIILQQTRVEQGWSYYEKFIDQFPRVEDLASAPEEKVFKLWEGLGYYSRCRNLIATARVIVEKYGGKFPADYEAIHSLRGIGPYTAAAIASFAFNLPHAVVDGNVTRVLSRYFGINTPIDSTAGRKLYTGLAQALLDTDQPGIYNQAIMDFGAVICKPQQPLCASCPQQADCQAFEHGWVNDLPVKEKMLVKKKRWMYYFIIETADQQIYIRQRKEKDIWADLFEFVRWEPEEPVPQNELMQSEFVKKMGGSQSLTAQYISKIVRQELTHQTIQGQFILIRLEKPLDTLNEYLLVPKKKLGDYAFPRFINIWLEDPSPVQSLF